MFFRFRGVRELRFWADEAVMVIDEYDSGIVKDIQAA
jgi:hypothetical protein